ncbi:MAG: response regulator [Rhodobacteraceae bacterium]|nr:response regulator [Paracoccaceae bacterium]
MRLIIVDDHPIFRDGLRRILEDSGHTILAECSDGLEAVDTVRAQRPDLVLMDLHLPRQDGLAAVRALGGRPPIVMLTVSEDAEDMREAIDAGASAYLLKSMDAQELVCTLEMVVGGYRVYPDGPASRDTVAANLSERQRQVLSGLIRGQTLKEIARELRISQCTVRTYQERLLEKFDVGSRAELIYAASGRVRGRLLQS